MAVTKIVRKNKDGRKHVFFMADVYVNGAKVCSKSFDNKAEAEVWHQTMKKNWHSGNNKSSLFDDDLTFGDCIEEYLNDREGFLKLRKSSKQSMEARMGYFSSSPIVRTRMKDFGAHTIDLWFNWILAHPTTENKGRKSFSIELKYFSIILNWYRNERNANFVVPIVRRHRKRAFFKPIKPRRKDYFIRVEDVMPWINWLKENRSDPVYYRIATFMLLTGARLGEACGLCWDRVDFRRQEIHISRTMSWDQKSRVPYLVDQVKTQDSDRLIYLPESLLKMFEELSKVKKDDGPVFRNSKGDFIRDNAVRSAFNAGFKALNLPWTATHICRHTWGTIGLKANGDNISKVQMTMGHSNRQTSEIYAKAAAQADSSTVINTAKMMGFS